MRAEGLNAFKTVVLPYLRKVDHQFLRVLILGGSLQDPEIELLQSEFDSVEVTFAGIDDTGIGTSGFTYLDFNESHKALPVLNVNVAVCTGVVEHLWNLDAMLKNFYALVPNSTLVWISFPVSQFPHGSPEWYSAGYNPSMISKLAEINGFQCLESGHFGNRRNYLFRHMLHLWPEKGEGVWFLFRWPLFSYIPTPGSLVKKFVYQLSTVPHRIILQFASTRTKHDILSSTAGWVLLQKISH